MTVREAEDLAVELAARHERVAATMRKAQIDELVVAGQDNLAYLTGVSIPPNVRLTVLRMFADGSPPVIGTSVLQAGAFDGAGLEIRQWRRDELAVEELAGWIEDSGHDAVALDDGFAVGRVLWLHSRLAQHTVTAGEPLVQEAKAVKSPLELGAVAESARRLERLWQDYLESTVLEGRSEIQVATEIRRKALLDGFDEIAWCDVGSGPNAAEPLHHGSSRAIARGEVLVVDLAGTVNGYYGDICRTVVVGTHGTLIAEAYGLVAKALDDSIAACLPGTEAATVDAVARTQLKDAPGDAQFIHRLGHGIGRAPQETLSLDPNSRSRLEAGHALAVEPGLYLPDNWGVRLEDNVGVQAGQPLRFTSAPAVLPVVD